MRNLIVCDVMSLDGYYTGPGNDFMALAAARGGAFDTYNAVLAAALRAFFLG